MPRTPLLALCLAGTALASVWLGACSAAQDSAVADDRFLNLAPDIAYVGDETCASCHGELYASYQTHGMAQSFYRLTPENSVEDWSGVTVRDAANGFVYVARRDGDRFVQEEYLEGADGTRTHQLVRTMDYVVGSGSAARTYLSEENGRLYELPLTWYTQAVSDSAQGTTVGPAEPGGGHWAFSPGYDVSNARFDRTVPERCMACHNGTSEAVPFAADKYASLADGIGCEQCHGPGALHVEARTEDPEAPDSIDVTIVNPKWLSLDLRLDVCQQCHLNGEVSVLRDGETETSFRPGRPLSAHRAVFGLAGEDPARVNVISHADRMKQSACFVESVAMDCVTCHNPHQGFRDAGPDLFNSTCRSCHSPDALQAAMPTAELRTQHAPAALCFSCHMPKVTADDAPHASFTDHWIRVVGEEDRVTGMATATRDLEPYFEQDTPDGVYTAMAYVVYGRQTGQAAEVRRGIGLLGEALERTPEMGEAQYLLGYARLQTGQAQAAIPPLEAARTASENPERLNTLAQAYEAVGRVADAEVLYLRALEIQPAAARTRVNLGRLRESQGRVPEAIRSYQEAIAEEPWLMEAHTLLGGAYARAGDVDRAIGALREAVRLEPRQPDALTNLGVLLAQSGNVQAAGPLLRRAVAVGPRNANALANLALYELNEGRPQEALGHAQAALAVNPNQATAAQVLQILQQAAR